MQPKISRNPFTVLEIRSSATREEFSRIIAFGIGICKITKGFHVFHIDLRGDVDLVRAGSQSNFENRFGKDLSLP